MQYIIVDLEATCWKKGTLPDRMEIIEIGAVMLDSSSGPVTAEFAEFVKPIQEPFLSDFCRELTTIRQEDVDSADTFQPVFQRFLNWIGDEPFRLCSWGAYDLRQFTIDCERHGIPFPASFTHHINLKKAFADLRGIKPCGMKGALFMLGMSLEGQHHRGIDDARNIAKVAQLVLPQIEHE